MFKRWLQPIIEKSLTRTRVLLLNGARQVGKTTLMQSIMYDKSYSYTTFDDATLIALVKNDPKGFLNSLKKPIILDEIQRVPELFLAIKMIVDADNTPGQFLLTGSANPLFLPKLSDSLAGRMEVFNLYPLSQGELLGKKETFIDQLFNIRLKASAIKTAFATKNELYLLMIKGGYPGVQSYDQEGRMHWFRSYISTILDRDVRDIAHIEGLTQLPLLLKLLATRAGTLLNVADLSRSIQIPNTTLQRYLALLQTIFFIYFQPPWYRNMTKRLVKAPKIYVLDTGLLASLLAIDLEWMLAEPHLIGGMLENFVINELRKQASWHSNQLQFYHFRTSDGVEIDTLIENAQGQLVAIEIKHSSTISLHDFKALSYAQKELGNHFVRGIILYLGQESYFYNDQICALSLASLWQ